MEKPYIVCHMMTSVGAGIDGRGGMGSVFDGLPMDRGVTRLRLEDVNLRRTRSQHYIHDRLSAMKSSRGNWLGSLIPNTL